MDRVVSWRAWKGSFWDRRRAWADGGITIEGQSLHGMRCRCDQSSNGQFLVQVNMCQKLCGQDDSRTVAELHTGGRDVGDSPLGHRKWRHVIDTGGSFRCRKGQSQNQAGASELFQCLKCLMPVNTMAIPAASAASITSWSRIEPPG